MVEWRHHRQVLTFVTAFLIYYITASLKQSKGDSLRREDRHQGAYSVLFGVGNMFRGWHYWINLVSYSEGLQYCVQPSQIS